MASLDEAFSLAFSHHLASRLDQAEVLYRRILVAEPREARTLHLLGALLAQSARAEEAAGVLYRSVEADPECPQRRVLLARVLEQVRRDGEAERMVSRALALAPADAGGWTLLGVLLRRRQAFDAALKALGWAVAIEPAREEALGRFDLLLQELAARREAGGDLDGALAATAQALALSSERPRLYECAGRLLDRLNRHGEVVACLARAVALVPARAHTWAMLAVARAQLSAGEPAVRAARRSVRIDPLNLSGWLNGAAALTAAGERALASAWYQRRLALDPASPDAWVSLGALGLGDGDDALGTRAIGRGLHLEPTHSQALTLEGHALSRAGRDDDALPRLDAAIASDSRNADARWARGLILLRLGEYRQGWAEYEWRRHIRVARIAIGYGDSPAWDGGRLGARILLLHAEQGLGDTIQMLRLVPLARERAGGPVVIEVPSPLLRLVRGALRESGVTVVAQGGGRPEFHVQAPMMSLPYLLGLDDAEHPPGDAPWLAPSAVSPRETRTGHGPLEVGIVWAGNRSYQDDAARSIAPALLAPLRSLSGARFHSLQWRAPREEIAAAGFSDDPLAESRDFADTARVVAGLDLVIGVDTAVIHLAGALGCPTWVMLPEIADFRWGRDRSDVPWYPGMRLFRQRRGGGWAPVVAAVGEALDEVLRARRSNGRVENDEVVA